MKISQNNQTNWQYFYSERFSDRKSKSLNVASTKIEYELAAELGLATKDEVACRKRYSTCPYTADEMMGALRDSQL